MSGEPNIPLPHVEASNASPVNPECELYDGDETTAWVCKGYITKTGTCIRRDDVICDGFGKITPK